ncbi:unnamed protein product [Caenorhabditis angaria]|uniref:THAP-type domain-containing protein n=1 Tax=Caenorhabditis angaria TaxID=860376 RepID=A0A9P1I8S4_9PELO|nr:unnamed protein product [Caenorhabditis angaria]
MTNRRRTLRCCYCEKLVERKCMTNVAANLELREKWISILGKQFSNNLKKVKHPMICRKHFKGNTEHRWKYKLPVRMDEDKEDEENDADDDEHQESEEFKKEDEVEINATIAELNQVQDDETGSNVPSTSAIPKNNGKRATGKQEVRKKRKIESKSEESSKRGELGEEHEENDDKEDDVEMNETIQEFNDIVENVPEKQVENQQENMDIEQVFLMNEVQDVETISIVPSTPKNNGKVASDEQEIRKKRRIDWNSEKSSKRGKLGEEMEKEVVEEQKENYDKVIEKQPKLMDLLRNVPKKEKEDNGIVIIQSPLNEILGEFGNMEQDVKDRENQKNSQENGLLRIKREEQGNGHLVPESTEIELLPNERPIVKEQQKDLEQSENICRICDVQLISSIQAIPVPTNEIGMKNQEIGEFTKKRAHTNTNKSKCCYCEKLTEQRYMTRVPTNLEVRLQWIMILGAQFAENVDKYNPNGCYFGRICMTHFSGHFTHRKKYEFPVAAEIQPLETAEEYLEYEKEEETTIEKSFRKSSSFLRTCCYCLKRLKQDEMKRVPSLQSVRQKWIEILGPRFARNLENIKYDCICRTHFKRFVKYRRNQLPVRMEEDNEEEFEIIEENPEVVEIIQRNSQRERIYQKFDEEFMNDETEDKNLVEIEKNGLLTVQREEKRHIFETNQKTCRICEIELDSSIKTIPIPTDADDFIKWMKNRRRTLRCCYCEQLVERKCMTNVAVNLELREKWINILGKQFANNLKKVKYPMICREHFKGNTEHRFKYKLPVRMDEDKEDEENDADDDEHQESEEFKKEDEVEINATIPELNQVQDDETGSNVPSTSAIPKNNGKRATGKQEVRKKRKINSNSEESSKRGKIGEEMEKENGLVEEQKENDDKEDNGIVIIQSPLNEILGEFGNMEQDVKYRENQKNSQEIGLLRIKREEQGNEHLIPESPEIEFLPNEIPIEQEPQKDFGPIEHTCRRQQTQQTF